MIVFFINTSKRRLWFWMWLAYKNAGVPEDLSVFFVFNTGKPKPQVSGDCLKCFGAIDVIFIGFLTLSQMLKLLPRKLEPWLALLRFLSAETGFILINLPFDLVWTSTILPFDLATAKFGLGLVIAIVLQSFTSSFIVVATGQRDLVTILCLFRSSCRELFLKKVFPEVLKSSRNFLKI